MTNSGKLLRAALLGIFAALIFFFAAAGMSGCAQEEGERCQITEDCVDGLVCCKKTSIEKPNVADIMNEGSCVASNECQEDLILH